MEPFTNPILITQPLLPDLKIILSSLEEVWETYRLSNQGKKEQFLEETIKNYLKVPYASLFNNGTIALITAIQSLRLSGEIITPAFDFPASPHAITWNKIKPVFCDVKEDTLNIDSNKIEELITQQTTAILPVHVFGTPCNVVKIKEIADTYGLRVIYDAAHAFGAEVNGIGIGNYGDISMFSFHATKLFHTAEGGALTFNSENLKKQIYLLKNFGIKNEDEVILPGINGKMSEIHASIGLAVLPLVEDEINKRKKLRDIYIENLESIEEIEFIQIPKNVKSNYPYFVIRIKNPLSRDFIYQELKKYNVFARKYFYPLCSNYPCYKQQGFNQDLKVAEKIVTETLALPFYGALGEDSVVKICNIIKEIIEKSAKSC